MESEVEDLERRNQSKINISNQKRGPWQEHFHPRVEGDKPETLVLHVYQVLCTYRKPIYIVSLPAFKHQSPSKAVFFFFFFFSHSCVKRLASCFLASCFFKTRLPHMRPCIHIHIHIVTRKHNRNTQILTRSTYKHAHITRLVYVQTVGV